MPIFPGLLLLTGIYSSTLSAQPSQYQKLNCVLRCTLRCCCIWFFFFFFNSLQETQKYINASYKQLQEILSKPLVQKATHRAGTPHGLRG